MKQTIFPKSRTIRELRKRVPLAGDGKGFTNEPDGKEEVYYKTEIDLDRLTVMALQAAKNGSGISIDGPLIVTVIERNRIEIKDWGFAT